MINPRAGVAFSLAPEGDMRDNSSNRRSISQRLGIPAGWASCRQVHGTRVLTVDHSGHFGEADALFTKAPQLPLAIFVADCVGLVLHGRGGVGVAHVGWRGAAQALVEKLVELMQSSGSEPEQAVVGPAIGPCCFEVGEEVSSLFPGFVRQTSWDTTSVDLPGVVADCLPSKLDCHIIRHCTAHHQDTFSHRDRAEPDRMVSLGWIPR